MKSHSWREVEEIFHRALDRDRADRDAYVREACHGDSELQREVASLLANHHEATDFAPWAAGSGGATHQRYGFAQSRPAPAPLRNPRAHWQGWHG
jgi:hypothetical protein